MKKKLFSNLKPLTTTFSLAILGITAIMLILSVTAFSDLAKKPAGKPSEENTVSTSNASVEYTINREIFFSSPESSAEFAIDNPEDSPYDIQVSITRNDNGKKIYGSGALRPGSHIKTAKLQGAQLPEGTYSCTAEVTTYEVGGTKKMESIQVPVTIYIGEDAKQNKTTKEK